MNVSRQFACQDISFALEYLDDGQYTVASKGGWCDRLHEMAQPSQLTRLVTDAPGRHPQLDEFARVGVAVHVPADGRAAMVVLSWGDCPK